MRSERWLVDGQILAVKRMAEVAVENRAQARAASAAGAKSEDDDGFRSVEEVFGGICGPCAYCGGLGRFGDRVHATLEDIRKSFYFLGLENDWSRNCKTI